MTTSASSYRVRQRPIASGRALPSPLPEFVQNYIRNGEAASTAAFKGVTTDGTVVPGLFPIPKTGVSTEPIKQAVESFLALLSPEQRGRATFPMDSEAWRRWSNIHVFTLRHGVSLDELSEAQRERALALLRVSLSAAGYDSARDIMKLNHTIGEITDRWEEYGEWLYWVSMFGTPSADQPWGWQIDGHHLILNCFVLGDQVVMTPMFWGSEPVTADIGKYAGTRVFADEEVRGLALMQALTPEQRAKATVSTELPGEVFTTAFRDNFEQRYEGIRYDELTADQQRLLLSVIEAYVGRIRPGHAEVRLEEVKRHLDETHFAWIGACDDDAVFYYRVHSPVILIEFDHQRGIALENDVPSRQHIHTVVRTPNGNDYGKDLLRQHYEREHTVAPLR